MVSPRLQRMREAARSDTTRPISHIDDLRERQRAIPVRVGTDGEWVKEVVILFAVFDKSGNDGPRVYDGYVEGTHAFVRLHATGYAELPLHAAITIEGRVSSFAETRDNDATIKLMRSGALGPVMRDKALAPGFTLREFTPVTVIRQARLYDPEAAHVEELMRQILNQS